MSDAGTIAERLHNIEILQRKMMDRIIALEDVRDQKSEPDWRAIASGFNGGQSAENLISNKHREIEELKRTVNQQSASMHNLYTQNQELEKDKKYWEEQVERLQKAYADIRWRFDNQLLVEKQTARKCFDIVNRIKNEPNNPIESQIKKAPHKWWIVCEDIEKAIKKEFDL